MATKLQSLGGKVEVSQADKTREKAAGFINKLLLTKGVTATEIRAAADYLANMADVFTQQGEGQGKRISGAVDTSLEANVDAFLKVYAFGRVPKIG